MGETAISVRNLGKRYRIGHQKPYHTLRDDLAAALRRPLRCVQHLVRCGTGSTDLSSEEFWALRHASFDVKQGEVVAIIGRNGAGKSTLLKLLSRITSPTEGRAEVCGRVGSLLEVGTGFHPELTGRENVYLNGAIIGMKHREVARKFDEIVDFAEVERFVDTPVKFYSSGMYMRLAFAVAAHLESEVLLIDEVLAVGDASFQKKCLGRMGDAAKSGRTVLFVSHNLPAVLGLCRSGILLADGHAEYFTEAKSAVAEYMSSIRAGSMEQRWDNDEAPGNQDIRITTARIVANEKDPAMLTVKDSFRIEFEFSKLRGQDLINLSLMVRGVGGECIFNTASSAKMLGQGSFTGTCYIPGDLLNDGIYSLDLLFVRDTSIIIYELKNILSFELHDSGRDGQWFGKWQGSVRPLLQWRIE